MVNGRRYERVPFMNGLSVTDLADGHQYKASGIDISAGGIGFYSDKFFETNTRICIRVRLKDSAGKDPVEVAAIVRWARLEHDGAIIGAEFVPVISRTEQPDLWELLEED